MFKTIKKYFKDRKALKFLERQRKYAEAYDGYDIWKKIKKNYLSQATIEEVLMFPDWYQGKIINLEYRIRKHRLEVIKYEH